MTLAIPSQDAVILAALALGELVVGFIFRPIKQSKRKDPDMRKIKWTMILGGFLVLVMAHFANFFAYWEYAEGMLLDGILVYTGFRV
ncbi:hypothetical protein [Sulfuracidifex metallicus]|uniref:Uncharacterized protein n=1 Tax=Sulfuracidifex metallicus DSM 6482 = JCM 9184 TaxID=523847 RepID=A0A6A9QL15_SULME|nr:hypothetical protein [Sulfuracidifex metallicus]MUN29977.1 hypothetical protein [Sulfuracidifex metallicus DSM 6482 = JCM 9184]WOE51641.1 hypothetical protein RQ359_000961 [Sulfuracidifex metallicus DSM 6482 = JCM 9184]